MLLIISPLALAICFKFLKFSICASAILVIIAISGFTIFDKVSISPFLLIPISKTPNLCEFSRLHKLRGTPNELLKDLGEKYVSP